MKRPLLLAAAFIGVLASAAPAHAARVPTVLLPNITITEPQSGSAEMMVNLALDIPNPRNEPVSVDLHDFTPIGVSGSNPPQTYGTATPGVDYLGPAVTTVTWQPGQRIASFPITLIGDTMPESSENINLRIDNRKGVFIGDNDANITIGDSGPLGPPGALPTILLPNQDIAEGLKGCAPYPVSFLLSQPTPIDTSLEVIDFTRIPLPPGFGPGFYGTAKPGKDYVPFPAFRLQFPAGSSSATFPITICGDKKVEANEQIDVRVYDTTGIFVGDNDIDLIMDNDD